MVSLPDPLEPPILQDAEQLDLGLQVDLPDPSRRSSRRGELETAALLAHRTGEGALSWRRAHSKSDSLRAAQDLHQRSLPRSGELMDRIGDEPLPTPLSPVIKTDALVRATWATVSIRATILALLPMIRS